MLLACPSARAQFYLTGQDRSHIRWNQLEVGQFRLIYPKEAEPLAFEYASRFKEASQTSISSLWSDGTLPRWAFRRDSSWSRRAIVPVVMHPYSSMANGMVVDAPFRMELYTLPSPDGSVIPWSQDLSLHEGRHVSQMLHADDGVFNVLHYIIGQQSPGIASGVYDFFSPGLLEGDAVMAETEFSQGGRGRQADFLMHYRAAFLSGTDYSYDKWHYGSYRHYIPNQYALGYLRFSAARELNQAGLEHPEKAQAQLFESISHHPFRYKKAYRQAYGTTYRQLWPTALGTYRKQWGDTPDEETSQLTAPAAFHQSYRYPLEVQGSLYAVSSSLSKTSRLVRIEADGSEKLICLLGYLNSPLTSWGPYVFWSQIETGPRWGQESLSTVCCYHVPDGSVSRLGGQSAHYYAPSPSPDGTYVAVAQYLPAGGSRLCLLSMSNGEEVHAFDVPDGAQLKEMVWLGGQRIYASVLTEDGMAIWSLQLDNGNWSGQWKPCFATLRSLRLDGFNLWFESDRNGTNQLYSLDLKTNTLSLRSQARFGAFDPCPLPGDSLIYADYQATGYRLVCRSAHDCKEPVPAGRTAAEPFWLHNAEPEQMPVIAFSATPTASEATGKPADETLATTAADGTPVSKPYRKLPHLLKFHSWAPLYYDLDELSALNPASYYDAVAPGVVLFTQNDLGTAYGQIGGSLHRETFGEGIPAETFQALHAKFTYAGWYPVFSVSAHVNDGYRSLMLLDSNTLYYYMLQRPSVTVDFLTYLPLSVTGGGWTSRFVPSFRYHYSNDLWMPYKNSDAYCRDYCRIGLQMDKYLNLATRDIFPRLGAGLQFEHVWNAMTLNYFSKLSMFSAYAYLPGLASNHAFKLQTSYQYQHVKRDETIFYLGNLMYPRGMDSFYAEHMTRLSLDYAFPVDIDLSIPGLVYLKRMECTPFAEFLQARNEVLAQTGEEKMPRKYFSYGLDAVFDLIPLRINAEVSPGLRTTYSPQFGWQFEFLLSVPYL